MALSVFEDIWSKRQKGLDSTRVYNAYYESHGRRGGSAANEATTELVGDLLDAVQSVVDALTDGRGGRYTVGFSDQGPSGNPGGTNLTTRQIIITSEPIFDKALSFADIATVLTGIAAHEIGHTRITPDTQSVLDRRWPGDKLAHVVANLIDDVTLENLQRRDFPGIGAAIRPALRWVVRRMKAKTKGPEQPVRWTNGMTLVERLNFAITAVRYAPYSPWIADRPTRTEREWWQDWSARYADERVSLRAEGIALALQHLRVPPQYEDEPEDQPEPETEQPEPDEDDESEDGEDSEDGEGIDDEDDDESDEDGESDDGDGDDGDAPGYGYEDDDLDGEDSGSGSGTAEGQSDSDGDEGDEPGSQDGSDEGTGLGSQGGEHTHEERHEGSTGDGGGGLGDHPIEAGEETPGALDLTDHEVQQAVIKTLDDLKQDDSLGTFVQKVVNKARTSERIVSKGGFGTMRVTIN